MIRGQGEGLYVRRSGGVSAWRQSGIRFPRRWLRHQCHRAILRDVQGQAQPGDPATDDDKIELVHSTRRLSMSRVFPKRTAAASNTRGRNWEAVCRVTGSTATT